MAKRWGATLFVVLTLYFVALILSLSYGQAVADQFGVDMGGETTTDISLNETFGLQYTCGYPRYRYNVDGIAARYFFDLDNLDCDISIGAMSETVCNAVQGCLWSNETTGFLWFRDIKGVCTGEINKTYYNDGEFTEDNVCDITGLQGDANVNTCSVLGCSVYAPKQDVSGGVSNPLTILDTVGDLFLFRYDFGNEEPLYDFLVNFFIFYIPFLLLLVSIYILSPFSGG